MALTISAGRWGKTTPNSLGLRALCSESLLFVLWVALAQPLLRSTPHPWSALKWCRTLYPKDPVILNLVDVSDIFYFFCSGKGESEAPGRGRGSVFLLKIPGERGGGPPRRGGGGLPGEGGGPRGLEGVCTEFGGGGARYFFSAPKKKNQVKILRSYSFTTQWARRDRLMSRGTNCRKTILVSHLSRNYPHRWVNLERG